MCLLSGTGIQTQAQVWGYEPECRCLTWRADKGTCVDFGGGGLGVLIAAQECQPVQVTRVAIPAHAQRWRLRKTSSDGVLADD